jgi:CRP-like cAMP-binding protein
MLASRQVVVLEDEMVRDGSNGNGVTGVVEALDRTWFGAALGPETQARLAGLARIERAPAGQVLLREGEHTEDVSIVMSGRIALRMLVPERGMVTILTVEPGDVLGWSALLPPHRATCHAFAIEDTTLLALRGEDLRAMLRADHALAANVYPRVLQAVARRLAATRFQLLDLFAKEPVSSEVHPW